MDAVRTLETRLADDLGRRHCIATGRGATAIWIGLQALGARTTSRKVILPATLCTSPVAATVLAGFEPLFCDVEALTGNLDPACLSKLLAANPDVACVIAAHLYGQPVKIPEIAALCANRGVALMEDAAQAYGADIGGRLVGGFGDVAIVSFGHTKILEAGGGGAILTDDDDLAAVLRGLSGALPAPPGELGAWSAAYRTDYYRLLPGIKNGSQTANLMGEMCLRHPDLYSYALTNEDAARVLAVLPALDHERDHRRAMARAWRRELAGAGLTLMDEAPGGVPWRFNALVPGGRRDGLAETLRHAGYDASPWYPVVARFFQNAPDYKAHWPKAARIEDEILNLWVDDSMNETRIRGACAVIKDYLRKGQAREPQ